MNDIVKHELLAPALQMDRSELIQVLSSSLYPGAAPETIGLVVDWCRASGKDPMKRPVHIVPMSVKKSGTRDQYEWRDVLMEGIGNLRTDAARTGAYAGIDDAQFGPSVVVTLGDVEITIPEWCSITVYRMVGGQRVGFSSGRVRWIETYATASRNSLAPNAMWKKRPFGQLEKCAEALALRRGFPEVGQAPTSDEMSGREISGYDIEAETGEVKPSVQMPQRKAASPAPQAQPQAEAQDVAFTDVGAASAPAPAPTPAAPAPAPAGVVSAGKAKWLMNKAAALGFDLQAAIAERFNIADAASLTEAQADVLRAELVAAS